MNLLITVFCQSKPQVGAFVPCVKAGKSINLKGFQDRKMISNVLSQALKDYGQIIIYYTGNNYQYI